MVAYELKMSVKDILKMDYLEFLGWLAYFKARSDELDEKRQKLSTMTR